jgi:N-acyl-D-aspartate/D-glutamate deacylase
MLVEVMEGVEDIPEVVMAEGLPWNWETFPQFLDALGRRAYDVDVAVQLPHSPLRVYVMGERGARREPATPEDCQRMAELAREAVRAGAIGVGTSRILFHRSSKGETIPTLTAGEAELEALALALTAEGNGVLQFVIDFAEHLDAELP